MFTIDDEQLLLRYLLDDVSEVDRESIEERYVTDEQWFEKLQALEGQLIRDYLRGELPLEQRKRFESKYLTVPGLRGKVEATSLLIDAAAQAMSSFPAQVPGATATPRFEQVEGANRAEAPASLLSGTVAGGRLGGTDPTPKPRWMPSLGTLSSFALAGVALVAAASFWLWLRQSPPQPQQAGRQPTQEQNRAPRPEPTNETGLPQSNRSSKDETRAAVRIESAKPSENPPTAVEKKDLPVFALLLVPVVRSTRGASTSMAKIAAPPEGSLLELLSDTRPFGGKPGETYVVSVRTVDDEKVVAQQTLHVNTSGQLAMRLPAAKVRVDDYITTIRNAAGEELAAYTWRVVPPASSTSPVDLPLRIVGSPRHGMIYLDGQQVGEISQDGLLELRSRPGRHTVALVSEGIPVVTRQFESNGRAHTTVDLDLSDAATGTVLLEVVGNLDLWYRRGLGETRPQKAIPGLIVLPQGQYLFGVKRVGTIPENEVKFERDQLAVVQPGSATRLRFRANSVATPTLFGLDWRRVEDGYLKLDGGRAAAAPGLGVGIVNFEVRRRGAPSAGKANWFYKVGDDALRFELGSDKLSWWVGKGGTEGKLGDIPMPRDVESLRLEITPESITHQIGGKGATVLAGEVGIASFAGGQLYFRGPIWIRNLVRIK